MAWFLDCWEKTLRKIVHGDEPHYRQRELWSAQRKPHGGIRALDTRRYNDAGKLIGGHNGKWGSPVTYCRRQFHRAERRHVKALLRGETHPRDFESYYSEYNWRGL